MLYRVQRLDENDYLNVYQMMREENFPETPKSFRYACLFFKQAFLYGVFRRTQLVAVFLFLPTSKKSAGLDAVCYHAYQKKWCTKHVLTQFLYHAFNTHNFAFLWTESKNKDAITMTSHIGFQPIKKTPNGVFSILTPEKIQKKWKDLYYGIFI